MARLTRSLLRDGPAEAREKYICMVAPPNTKNNTHNTQHHKMQHHVSIATREGILEIPDEQISMFDLIAGVVDAMGDGSVEDTPTLVLPVMNMPMKCYEAVVNYAAYYFQLYKHAEPEIDHNLLITPKEAEIVSKLETGADFCKFIKAAKYLGNDACIAFATRMLLRNMALQLIESQTS